MMMMINIHSISYFANNLFYSVNQIPQNPKYLNKPEPPNNERVYVRYDKVVVELENQSDFNVEGKNAFRPLFHSLLENTISNHSNSLPPPPPVV